MSAVVITARLVDLFTAIEECPKESVLAAVPFAFLSSLVREGALHRSG